MLLSVQLHVFTQVVMMLLCYRQVAGRTKSAEAGEKTQDVNMFYTQPLSQLPVFGTIPEINITQVMAIDKQVSDARFVVTVMCYNK